MKSYCTHEEITNLFGNIPDDLTDDILDTVTRNSKAWIETNLRRNNVPIPDKDVNALRTCAIYYSASDILLALYHGDDLPAQYDVWFQKARDFLDAYIEAYWNDCAAMEEQVSHSMVKHSHGLTYNQKRGRRLY